MKKYFVYSGFLLLILIILVCNWGGKDYDVLGSFEVIEWVISVEVMGVIKKLDI